MTDQCYEPKDVVDLALRSCLGLHSKEELQRYELWPANPKRNIRMQAIVFAAALACEEFGAKHPGGNLVPGFLSHVQQDAFHWAASDLVRTVSYMGTGLVEILVVESAPELSWYRFPCSDYTDPAMLRNRGEEELELSALIREKYAEHLKDPHATGVRIEHWLTAQRA